MVGASSNLLFIRVAIISKPMLYNFLMLPIFTNNIKVCRFSQDCSIHWAFLVTVVIV